MYNQLNEHKFQKDKFTSLFSSGAQDKLKPLLNAMIFDLKQTLPKATHEREALSLVKRDAKEGKIIMVPTETTNIC